MYTITCVFVSFRRLVNGSRFKFAMQASRNCHESSRLSRREIFATYCSSPPHVRPFRGWKCPDTTAAAHLKLFHLRVDLLIGVHLFFELLQCGRGLGHPALACCLDLLVGQDVPVEQELPQELVPVVHPQVGVVLVGVAVLHCLGGGGEVSGQLANTTVEPTDYNT